MVKEKTDKNRYENTFRVGYSRESALLIKCAVKSEVGWHRGFLVPMLAFLFLKGGHQCGF